MKDKYLQVFSYLRELTKIRSKTVRDILNQSTSYPEIIWFDELPQHFSVQTITNQENSDHELWISVEKPEHPGEPPEFAELPEVIQSWVVPESLLDTSELPQLHEQIQVGEEIKYLSDHPKVKSSLDSYVDNQWREDVAQYQDVKRVYDEALTEFNQLNKVYKQFFSIYNKADHFGEEYELVMGLGLIAFKEDDNTPRIYRHLATTRADIELVTKRNKTLINVLPNAQDFQLHLETDFIVDLDRQFSVDNIIQGEKKAKEILAENEAEYLPFDAKVKEAFQVFAARIRPDATFEDQIERPTTIPKNPKLFYAPALILRKRNVQGLHQAYEHIVKTIEEAEESVSFPSVTGLVDKDFQDTTSTSYSDENAQIYFPKKYNDDQLAIIEKARRNRKVLVQGPPGTGKSHTIGNLISHLLATGNKVLVTSYSTRALQVLKGQLPQAIQSLAVNLLGGDTASVNDLKASVKGINEELEQNHAEGLSQQIQQATDRLDKLKRERATTEDELLSVQEGNFRSTTINEQYQGTLNELAEKLADDANTYDWFTDEIIEVDQVHAVPHLKDYFQQYRSYTDDKLSELKLEIPDPDTLPSVEDIDELTALKQALQQQNFQKVDKSQSDQIVPSEEAVEKLQKLVELRKSLTNEVPESTALLNDLNGGRIDEWENNIRESEAIVSRLQLQRIKWFDQNIEVTFPPHRSVYQLKSDAYILLIHLKAGNSFSGIGYKLKKPFLPKDVKERLYFIDEVRVNGSPCDTEQEFAQVREVIIYQESLEEIAEVWGDKIEKAPKSYYRSFQEYIQRTDHARKALNSFEQMRELAQELSSAGISLASLQIEELEHWLDYVEYTKLQASVAERENRIERAIASIHSDDLHPIAQQLKQILEERNSSQYQQVLGQIQELREAKNAYENLLSLETNLSERFPHLVASIQAGEITSEQIASLTSAIYWAHARRRMRRLLSDDAEPQLRKAMDELDQQIDKTIEGLAAKKAWYEVIVRLESKSSLRRHLNAWALAVSKIGKTGRGKKAMKNRLEAQNQLEHCKEAVPCWIMPVYKVAETMKPQAEMFDYVIVDEASQLGPEALFLFYLAKKIIIVGDDKQTSPEYIGVNHDVIKALIKKYLQGIPFSNFYSLEYSFFDHARMLCEGMTTLREHFRCMPEIIEFSNKLCYEPEGCGLYPLKQYSENRLDPLQTIYCADGYTEGSGTRMINLPEAEQVVKQIQQCISDARYQGKTLGVISLQGDHQAQLIEKLLMDAIGPEEFEARRLVCGNSASFQGDERDVMILSLVTARNHNRRALTSPADERRFNVAVSRAKEQIFLVHSVQLDDLSNTEDLRFRLLDHFLHYHPETVGLTEPVNRSLKQAPEPFDSWFEVDVFNDIVRKGHAAIPQYKVAKGKYRIDLVILLGNGVKLAIECDGDHWHGPEHYRKDMGRQKILERCGWTFFRVRASAYYFDRVKAMEPLWELIRENETVQCEKDEEPVAKNTAKVYEKVPSTSSTPPVELPFDWQNLGQDRHN